MFFIHIEVFIWQIYEIGGFDTNVTSWHMKKWLLKQSCDTRFRRLFTAIAFLKWLHWFVVSKVIT